MKILGGKFKGRNIFMPAVIRPTQNVTKQAIFNLLGHDLEGLEILELFAGSGAVGIEALSRGAKRVTFVEHDPKCVEVIRKNLELLGVDLALQKEPVCEIIHTDAFAAIKGLASRNRKFDLIFFDPPYGLDLGKKALKTLGAYDILHPNCFVVVEYSKRERLPDLEESFKLVTERQYGKSFLAVFQALKTS
jgi:16S rRNA (guanine966-N2)-methyltransferase